MKLPFVREFSLRRPIRGHIQTLFVMEVLVGGWGDFRKGLKKCGVITGRLFVSEGWLVGIVRYV